MGIEENFFKKYKLMKEIHVDVNKKTRRRYYSEQALAFLPLTLSMWLLWMGMGKLDNERTWN